MPVLVVVNNIRVLCCNCSTISTKARYNTIPLYYNKIQ